MHMFIRYLLLILSLFFTVIFYYFVFDAIYENRPNAA